jgi:hypothetical protein
MNINKTIENGIRKHKNRIVFLSLLEECESKLKVYKFKNYLKFYVVKLSYVERFLK